GDLSGLKFIQDKRTCFIQSKDKAAKVKKAAQLSNSSVAKEWSNLQLEIDKARRKASAGCELCRNYEAQLQTAQAAQRERAEEATRLSTALRAETARAAELSAGLADAEARAGEAAERWREQADEFARQTDELRACLDQLECASDCTSWSLGPAELARLLEDRTALQSELQQLERWYNHLLESRDGRTAQQMRDELIDLPDNLDDAQVLALQLREDLITARANLEHVRQRGRDQLAFAKQQLEEEVAMRRQLQAQLQSESDRLKSVQSELQAAAASRHKLEDRLQRQREEAAEAEAALRSAEAELKARLGRSECEAAELKNRAAFLQVELQNAMSVQKDFVELSQSLQVQLEGLRQQDTAEVRWQFPEDAAACHSCQRKFAASAKPRRCLHCVRLFCQACTDKTGARWALPAARQRLQRLPHHASEGRGALLQRQGAFADSAMNSWTGESGADRGFGIYELGNLRFGICDWGSQIWDL
uniref:FYVE-type domain-containing protein n=1 Tax=Macrostomum lignano TaxID=282301 RepID=A0A1I8JD86_9PLAT